MFSIKIDYGMVDTAVRKAEKAGKEYCDYYEELNKKATKKIKDVTGGQSSHTSNAISYIDAKVRKLCDNERVMKDMALSLREIKTEAETTDNTVKSLIKSNYTDFRSKQNIKVNKVEDFFAHMFNSDPMSKSIKDNLTNAGEWAKDRLTDLKQWYNFDGGKEWIELAAAVGLAAVAVIACIACFPAAIAAIGTILAGSISFSVIAAIAAGVTALIGAGDAIVKVYFKHEALRSKKNGDPAWAKHIGQFTDLSTFFEKYRFKNDWWNKASYTISNSIEGVSLVCSAICIVDFTKNAKNALKSFKSGTLWAKPIHFTTTDGKVTFNTIKYGLKGIYQNYKSFTDAVSNPFDKLKALTKLSKAMKPVKTISKYTEKLVSREYGEIIESEFRSHTTFIDEIHEIHDFGEDAREFITGCVA